MLTISSAVSADGFIRKLFQAFWNSAANALGRRLGSFATLCGHEDRRQQDEYAADLQCLLPCHLRNVQRSLTAINSAFGTRLRSCGSRMTFCQPRFHTMN